MAVQVRLGRRPAVADPRVPFLHQLAASRPLPAAPDHSNYYAGPEEQSAWGMLGNDTLGDCVPAAVLHLAKVHASYADAPIEPTTAEAIEAYETQGYVPGNPSTDQGSVMLGPTGIMQRWLTHGFSAGGRLSKIDGFVQLRPTVLEDWRQGLHYFEGLLLGIRLPANVVAGDVVPFNWRNPLGPIAGLHEILAVGCFAASGEWLIDTVTWGMRCRMPWTTAERITEEVQAVLNPAALNKAGVNADGFDRAALANAMDALKAAA
jgi:hypothetical protein